MSNQPTSPPPEISVHCAFDEMVALPEIKPNPRNPNRHPPAQIELLAKIIRHQGWRLPVLVSNLSGLMVSGHGRYEAAMILGVESVPVNFQDFENEADELAHLVADNRLAEISEMDSGSLKELLSDLDTGAIDMELTGFTETDLETLLTQFHVPDESDAEPKIDQAEELQKKWGTKLGQVWELGDHRIACGDSTAPETLAKLMGEEKAALLHADPPYGMGKEKDGVANDNLYRDKLDAFQMDWWRACRPHLEDNASAYIWGNAPDLWRLWYVGGLADLERAEVRNYIIWDKPPSAGPSGSPIGSAKMRSYPHGYESCLFFMIGLEEFSGNRNAEDFWEPFEQVRAALEAECEKMGWGAKDIKKICGVGMYAHWFTRSQWSFIPETHYRKLQAAAKGVAFADSYASFEAKFMKADRAGFGDLRDEHNSQRAYFDNAHANMTDVWDYGRVTGEERHGHATPKPVEMMCRCIKSSTPSGALVIEPFLGSGTTLIACENLGRKCRAIELAPEYVAVAIERWHEVTGKDPELLKV